MIAKVHLDNILAQLGVGEMTSEEELDQLVRKLREGDEEAAETTQEPT